MDRPMIELLQSMPESVVLFILILCGFILSFFFKELWKDRKNRSDKQTEALLSNTMAIQKLEIQVERLNEFLHVIPKLQQDIHYAHQKIRELTVFNGHDE